MNGETVKHVADAAAASVAVGAFMAWLPPLAALFTIVWTGIRIYETETFRRLAMSLAVKGLPGTFPAVWGRPVRSIAAGVALLAFFMWSMWPEPIEVAAAAAVKAIAHLVNGGPGQ